MDLPTKLILSTLMLFLHLGEICGQQNEWLLEPSINTEHKVVNVFIDHDLLLVKNDEGKYGLKNYLNEIVVPFESRSGRLDTTINCIVLGRNENRTFYNLEKRSIDVDRGPEADAIKFKRRNKRHDLVAKEHNETHENFKFHVYNEESILDEGVERFYSVLTSKGDTIISNTKPFRVKFHRDKYCYEVSENCDIYDVTGKVKYSPKKCGKFKFLDAGLICYSHHSGNKLFDSEFNILKEDIIFISHQEELKLFSYRINKSCYLTDGNDLDILKLDAGWIDFRFGQEMIRVIGDSISYLYNAETKKLDPLPFQINVLRSNNTGTINVVDNGREKAGLYDLKSRKIIQPLEHTYISYSKPYYETKKSVPSLNSKSKCTLLDSLGNLVFEIKDESVHNIEILENGIFLINYSNKTSELYSSKFKLAHTFSNYEEIRMNSDETAIIVTNENGTDSYLIGALISGHKSKYPKIGNPISNFDGKSQYLTRVYNEDNKCGAVNLNGELVIPMLYESLKAIGESKETHLVVEKDGEIGIMIRP